MTTEDKSMQNQGYNGWTNRETWLINMWFGDDFIYEKIKKDGVSDAETLKDILEEYIFSEQGYDEPRNGYITDVLAFTLCEVNWKEIFDRYASELELQNYNYNTEAKLITSEIVENSLKHEEKRTIEVYDCETEKLVYTFSVSEEEFKEDYEWCLNEPEKHLFGPDSDVKWGVMRLKGDTSPIPSR